MTLHPIADMFTYVWQNDNLLKSNQVEKNCSCPDHKNKSVFVRSTRNISGVISLQFILSVSFDNCVSTSFYLNYLWVQFKMKNRYHYIFCHYHDHILKPAKLLCNMVGWDFWSRKKHFYTFILWDFAREASQMLAYMSMVMREVSSVHRLHTSDKSAPFWAFKNTMLDALKLF